MNGLLYVAGGYRATAPLRTVQAYNPGTNTWTSRAPLPATRHDVNGGAVINGRLYVAGGEDSLNNMVKTLFVYNPSTNSWATKAPMLLAASCGVSAAIGGKLYVYGGCGADEPAFQRYDPATDSWTELRRPFVRRLFAAGAVTGGKLYLVGGIAVDGKAFGDGGGIRPRQRHVVGCAGDADGPTLSLRGDDRGALVCRQR